MLHAVNGDSARGAVGAATDGADVIACRDVLTVGPLPHDAGPAAWSACREGFWRRVFGDTPLPHADTLAPVLEACRRAALDDGLVLWTGAAASDQFFVAWLLSGLCDVREHASVLIVDLAADGRGVRGPAELSPAALAACAAPKPVSEQNWQAYAAAWRALISPSPESWPALAGKRRTPPALAAAIRIMIRRLPDRVRGIGRLDERLLAMLAAGRASRRDLLRDAMTSGEPQWRDTDYDTVGDVYLNWRIERMLDPSLHAPLLQRSGARIALTEFGSDVLGGRANAVAINGIDDDVGGVRLRTGGAMWWRDGDRVLGTPPPTT